MKGQARARRTMGAFSRQPPFIGPALQASYSAGRESKTSSGRVKSRSCSLSGEGDRRQQGCVCVSGGGRTGKLAGAGCVYWQRAKSRGFFYCCSWAALFSAPLASHRALRCFLYFSSRAGERERERLFDERAVHRVCAYRDCIFGPRGCLFPPRKFMKWRRRRPARAVGFRAFFFPFFFYCILQFRSANNRAGGWAFAVIEIPRVNSTALFF